MVQEVLDQSVLEQLQSISQRISDPTTGAYVSISPNAAALGALKDLLQEKVKKDGQVFDEVLKNRFKEQDKKIDKRFSKIEEIERLKSGEVKEKKKIDLRHHKTLESLAEAIKDRLEDDGEEAATRGEKIIIALDIFNKSMKLANKIFKDISRQITDNVKNQIDMVGLIRSSGVVIKSGFDETFVQFANEAGMSRESFAQALSQNSRFIASVNASGMNGAELLAKESRKLIGTLGLTSGEIESATKAYNESMLTTANQADIASIDHTNELMKSTRALKTFAMATGQSVENILKEQRAKEKSWQMQRLATDQRTRSQFLMMRNLGLSDDMIEAIMLGKHNKASTMAMLDPYSAQMMNDMRRAYMSTINNPEAFRDALVRLNHSSAAEGMRQREANTNVMDYAYINGLGELFAPGTTQWGMLTASRMGMNENELLNGTDAQALNALQELTATINGLKNNFVNALTPSLNSIISFLHPGSTISTVLTNISNFLGEHPIKTLILYGSFIIGKNMASSFLGGLAQAKAYKMMGIGVSEEVKKVLWSDMSKWQKAGKIFGTVASAVLGGVIGREIGEMIGGKTGGVIGGWAGAILGGAIKGATMASGLGIKGLLIGALAGAAVGATMHLIEKITSDEKEDKMIPESQNSPASASNTSTYNTSYVDNEQQSSGGTVQPSTVQSTHSSVSVVGIEGLRSLLRDNNAILKNIYSELRTGPMKPGTNMVG